MNLPFILDVAIGLIFIYLILSLLASEIQELLTTLLQWRAIHLKQSIEVLLTGGETTQEVEEVKSIVHDLYDNPLIKNINHEAKSGIAILLRQFTWGIAEAYRQLRGKKKGDFNGKRSGPSYIPAETFSTTLLDKLSIAKLSHNFTCANLKKFKEDEIKAPIEAFINAELQISENTLVILQKEVAIFEENLDKIFDNFKSEKASLITTINRIKFELEVFIDDLTTAKIHFQEEEESYKERLIKNLEFLKANIFSDYDNTEELVNRLQPSLDKVIRKISISSQIWKEYQNVKDDPNSEIYQKYHELEEEMQAVIHKLPPQLLESLCALAARAQIKAVKVEEEVNQFKKEIETWFDHSMDRASGVYKRNAKGVAFLIGFFLAISANADTFHIIDRLSKDTTLRNAIAGSATQIRQTSAGLEGVTKQVNQVLSEIAFPIGWSIQNLPHEKQPTSQILAYIKKFFGWLVSGVAISMGASFWFEMLGKLINVRNTGIKPKSSLHNQAQSQE